MNTKETGGPAFPTDRFDIAGATLRDYMAAKAMQGTLSREASDGWTEESIARAAYRQADAMLDAREKS